MPALFLRQFGTNSVYGRNHAGKTFYALSKKVYESPLRGGPPRKNCRCPKSHSRMVLCYSCSFLRSTQQIIPNNTTLSIVIKIPAVIP